MGAIQAESREEWRAWLEAEGRMHPTGLAMVELAKREGTWDALGGA